MAAMKLKKTVVELHLDLNLAATLMGGMTKRWMRDRIHAGEIDGFLVGNKYVVTAASVNTYLEKCRVGPFSADAVAA